MIHIYYPPTPVGYYEIYPGLHFQTNHKPNIWHRFWTKVFFGWTWHSYSS